jgi:hypothetical protein
MAGPRSPVVVVDGNDFVRSVDQHVVEVRRERLVECDVGGASL